MHDLRQTTAKSSPVGRTTLVNAFRVAFIGLGYAVRTQRNLQIHLAIGLAVFVAGFVAGLNGVEWGLIVLCVGMTWTAELLNTSVEVLVDLLSPEYHERARVAKDVAAAAVLCSAGASAVVGLLIFVPKLAPGLFRGS